MNPTTANYQAPTWKELSKEEKRFFKKCLLKELFSLQENNSLLPPRTSDEQGQGKS